jgi:hypothetical protein
MLVAARWALAVLTFLAAIHWSAVGILVLAAVLMLLAVVRALMLAMLGMSRLRGLGIRGGRKRNNERGGGYQDLHLDVSSRRSVSHLAIGSKLQLSRRW